MKENLLPQPSLCRAGWHVSLDQGRDLAAGLPGRPVVIFQPRNLPELFPACCRIRSASPEQERHRMSRGHGGAGPSSCGSAADTPPESVTTWNKPINRVMQE